MKPVEWKGVQVIKRSAVLAFGFMTFASVANAATITNGDFEIGPATAPNGFVTLNASNPGQANAIAGWTVTAGSIDYINNYWNANSPSHSIDLNGLEPATISTTISGLVIGQTYEITFFISGNPEGAPPVATLDVLLGASVLDNATFVKDPQRPLTWQKETSIFTASQTSQVLSFKSTTTAPDGFSAFGPAIDDVSIAAVPEPATWAMMMLGFAGIGFTAYRQRKKRTARFA